jgi:putative ubiquitin-RnfH superfamily antitoxin RatB of RatAB toxin-antitoxin module
VLLRKLNQLQPILENLIDRSNSMTTDTPVPAATIRVEVVYALPDRQTLLAVNVPKGSSLYEAVRLSGVTRRHPEIDLDAISMGVYGKVVPKPKDREIAPGERVELYRPLLIDPKAVRKKRAEAKPETD